MFGFAKLQDNFTCSSGGLNMVVFLGVVSDSVENFKQRLPSHSAKTFNKSNERLYTYINS